MENIIRNDLYEKIIKLLPLFGVAINVYSIVIYTGILSFWMYKYIKNLQSGLETHKPKMLK
jgi:hypothetical protein